MQHIRGSAAPVAAPALEAVEAALGLKFPADYRAFLLAHNGGTARKTLFRHTVKGKPRYTNLGRIFSASDLAKQWAERPTGLPAGLLPVADGETESKAGIVCIACAGPDFGGVFYVPRTTDKPTAFPVGKAWKAFYDSLGFRDGKPPQDWEMAVQEADPVKLRGSLEASDRWKKSRPAADDIADVVIDEGHWPLLKVLADLSAQTAHGWGPSQLFDRCLSRSRPELVRRLLAETAIEPSHLETSLRRPGVGILADAALVRQLIEAGAEIEDEDRSYRTPLFAAIDHAAVDTVRVLLEAGADPYEPDASRRTALQAARRVDSVPIVELLERAIAARRARLEATTEILKPFDLCGVTISGGGPRLSVEDIRKAEDEWGATFPPEYRWFLTQANGGRPEPEVMILPQEFCRGESDDEDTEDRYAEGGVAPPREIEVRVCFNVLRKDDFPDEDESDDGYDEFATDLQSVEGARASFGSGWHFPRGTLPVGHFETDDDARPSAILLAYKGKHSGQLLLADYDHRPLGADLPGLLKMLASSKDRPPTPEIRLHDAIVARDIEGVREALKAGARIHSFIRDDETTLAQLAIESDFPEATMAMLEAGAEPGALFAIAAELNRDDLLSPLFAAGKGPSKPILIDALRAYPGVYLMPELPTILTRVEAAKLVKKNPEMLVTAARASVAAVQKLIDLGGDPKLVLSNGRTALHGAAGSSRGESAEIVRFLLTRGVPVGRADENGWTALHLAAYMENVESAKLLIDAGEDLRARFETRPKGVSPGDAAREARRAAKELVGMKQLFGGDMEVHEAPNGRMIGGKATLVVDAFDRLRRDMVGVGGQVSGSLEERIALLAAGSWGKGPSAAELGMREGMGDAVEELDAYQAERKRLGG